MVVGGTVGGPAGSAGLSGVSHKSERQVVGSYASWGLGEGDKCGPDFFVFGLERSGTTLLGALLSNHPEVCVACDTHVFRSLNDVMTPRVERLLRKGLANYVGAPALRARREGHHLPPPERRVTVSETRRFFSILKARLWQPEYLGKLDHNPAVAGAQAGRLTVAGLTAITYSQLLPDSERRKHKMGDKTPSHLFLSPALRARYPRSRIITLIRQPLTNVATLFKRGHVRSISTAIDMYLSSHARRFSFLYDHQSVHLVRYEDMVRAPDEVLSGVHGYLGLEPRSTGTSFNYYMRRHYVGTVVDPSRDKKALSLLDVEQQRLVRRRCRTVFERFYPELV